MLHICASFFFYHYKLLNITDIYKCKHIRTYKTTIVKLFYSSELFVGYMDVRFARIFLLSRCFFVAVVKQNIIIMESRNNFFIVLTKNNILPVFLALCTTFCKYTLGNFNYENSAFENIRLGIIF